MEIFLGRMSGVSSSCMNRKKFAGELRPRYTVSLKSASVSHVSDSLAAILSRNAIDLI